MLSLLRQRSTIITSARILPRAVSRSPSSSPSSFRSFSSTVPKSRIADDFVDIFADAPRPAISVASITPAAGFTLTDGLIIPSPVIFLNGVVFLWDVAAPNTEDFSWEGWSEAKLKLFEVVTPRPEILLVGTGKRGLFPPPAFKKYLNGLGIQVDVLDSRNACATYNLLTEEGRRVAAALYPLSPLDARTGTAPQ